MTTQRTPQGWHFGHNMPGYLPESDVEHYNSRTAATASAQSHIRELREDGYVVKGSARDGDWYAEPRGEYGGSEIHIWVVPCQEVECQEDSD